MEQPVTFGMPDYVIMGLMLTFSMAIGVYFAIAGRKNTSQDEYLLGGRNMSVVPVCLSLFATFNSAISLLGIPAEVYSYGTMAIYMTIALSIAALACNATLIPLIYPLRVTSIYQYLQLRFNSRGVRLIGACMGMFQTICYMTIALLSPALALQTAAGLPLWVSLIAVGAVGTVYTAIGGIKSVVWTDAFQSIIIFGGIIVTIVKGCIDVGGFGEVWRATAERGRLTFDDVSLDPRVRHTVMGCLIGGTTNWLATYFGQSFSQRICATKSEKHARRVVYLVAPINLVYGFILVATGMTILVYFDHIGCDPMAAGFVTNANQLMPYFVIRTLSFIPGLAGLYISTIFSGALSTLSSGINALAANTVEDILHPVLRNVRESKVTAISKLIVFLYGFATIGLAYMAKEVKGPMTQITYIVMGGSGGPVFGLFLLGAIFPQGNKVGASIGCLAGLAFCLWLNIAKFFFGTVTHTLPLGPTDTCLDPSLAIATGTNATSQMGMILSGTAAGATFNQSLDMTGRSTIASLVDPSPTMMNTEPDDFHIYDISYLWIPLLGILTSLFSGLIISKIYALITGTNERPKPEYIFPFMRKVWYRDYQLKRTKGDEGQDEGQEMKFMLNENENI